MPAKNKYIKSLRRTKHTHTVVLYTARTTIIITARRSSRMDGLMNVERKQGGSIMGHIINCWRGTRLRKSELFSVFVLFVLYSVKLMLLLLRSLLLLLLLRVLFVAYRWAGTVGKQKQQKHEHITITIFKAGTVHRGKKELVDTYRDGTLLIILSVRKPARLQRSTNRSSIIYANGTSSTMSAMSS